MPKKKKPPQELDPEELKKLSKKTYKKIGTKAAIIAKYGKAQYTKIIDYAVENKDMSKGALMTRSMNKFKRMKRGLVKQSRHGFDAVFKEIVASDLIDLTDTQIERIAQYKSTMIDDMGVPLAKLKNNLKLSLILNQTSKKTQKQLKKALQNHMPMTFAYNVDTVFNTYLQRTFSESAFTATKKDFKHFIYSGPQDSRNRPFCKSHVNLVFTESEASRLQNQRMQEYNCRHTLIPFVGSESERMARRGVVVGV